MENNNLTFTENEKDVKEEARQKSTVYKKANYQKRHSQSRQEYVLDSMIEYSRELAIKNFPAVNIGKETDIPDLLRKDFYHLIEDESMGYLKAYSIIKLAETMLLEVNRHFVPVRIR